MARAKTDFAKAPFGYVIERGTIELHGLLHWYRLPLHHICRHGDTYLLMLTLTTIMWQFICGPRETNDLLKRAYSLTHSRLLGTLVVSAFKYAYFYKIIRFSNAILVEVK